MSVFPVFTAGIGVCADMKDAYHFGNLCEGLSDACREVMLARTWFGRRRTSLGGGNRGET